MIKKLLRYWREYGVKYLVKKIYFRCCIRYRFGKKYFPINIPKETQRRQQDWKPKKTVKISIAVPLYNTTIVYLCELIESIQAQTYPHWELCLADASQEKNRVEIFDTVQRYAAGDNRIHYKKLPCNDGIAGNTNQALEMSTGDYIALADHDDILHPSALYYVMQEIIRHQADFIYTDELSFVKNPSCVQSIHFKNEFSMENFRNNNFICHLAVFHRILWEKTGGFRKEFDGSQDYDLFLRMTEQAERICHVPRVLYYWRCHAGSVASQVGVKPYTIEAGRRALEEHLERKGLAAEVSASEYGTFYQIRYHLPEKNKILVLAETNTTAEQLRNQIKRQAPPFCCALEIMDVQSLAKEDAVLWEDWDMVALLRDGYQTEQAYGQWLGALLECLQPEENFAVSPMVFDRKGRIYFSGYCYHEKFPEKIRPVYRGMPGKDPGYMNRAAFRQTASLLGGAVLAVRGNIWQQIYEKWAKEEPVEAIHNSLFEDRLWFAICMEISRLQGKCIVTPDAFFQCHTVHNKEYQPEPSVWEQMEWKEFLAKWGKCLEEVDPNMNPWMHLFGKYYFLW